MDSNTGWTPSSEENLLGLTDKDLINEYEAKGITKSELYVFGLDSETAMSAGLVLDIHRVAFGELYDWAGKWRTVSVTVGQLEPPDPYQVPQLIYQFIDNLNFKMSISNIREEHLDCLVYAHYEFIRIHPFNNGNGRTGRILMNWVALKFGYKPLELYHRAGEARKTYINAIREVDKGNYEPLTELISSELSTF
jgi:cell filamentation protein